MSQSWDPFVPWKIFATIYWNTNLVWQIEHSVKSVKLFISWSPKAKAQLIHNLSILTVIFMPSSPILTEIRKNIIKASSHFLACWNRKGREQVCDFAAGFRKISLEKNEDYMPYKITAYKICKGMWQELSKVYNPGLTLHHKIRHLNYFYKEKYISVPQIILHSFLVHFKIRMIWSFNCPANKHLDDFWDLDIRM